MVHVDFYRLLDADGIDLLGELDSLDLDTDLDDAVVVVEWGEGLAERLSEHHLDVTLTVGPTARSAPRHGGGPHVSRTVLAIDTATPAVTAGVLRRHADGGLPVLAQRIAVDGAPTPNCSPRMWWPRSPKPG